MKLRKGDNVIMLSGKDRGKTGKVVSVIPELGKIVVEGLNMMKRHTKARRKGEKGQIISKERAINIPSVAIVCKSCGKPTRIGFDVNPSTHSLRSGQAASGQAGTKTRICKKCKNAVS